MNDSNQITGSLALPLGPVMLDVQGLEMTREESLRLSHPAVGGVILFRRNYKNRKQLMALTHQIKALRYPPLLIAVDHEGGRVQRFLPEFTALPPMRSLGTLYDKSPVTALKLAEETGFILATELRACGVDLSFTPVLDLEWQRCAVIGNRSFHAQPEVVIALASALQKGLHLGGMGTCGKHFPGHGFVEGDSHKELPVDTRSRAELDAHDIKPFIALIKQGMTAIMPAHVVYPDVDAERPAGFSPTWLKTILRQQLHFDGIIFSDDLSMEGAVSQGNVTVRANLALDAGCDMVLVCNQPQVADELLSNWTREVAPELAHRLNRMMGVGDVATWQAVLQEDTWAEKQQRVANLTQMDVKNDRLAPAVGEVY
ncbi:MAG: beta-N-acetylhexosaminidase [Neisseriaceae bacterium]|nr:beta-N-acetylhexosaminidase [Neisseriaceae bacterium]